MGKYLQCSLILISFRSILDRVIIDMEIIPHVLSMIYYADMLVLLEEGVIFTADFS